MRDQTLYRSSICNGVTALLTADAYQALLATMAFAEMNSDHSEIDSELERRISNGTMTFVEEERWFAGGTHVRVLHSGTQGMLDVIERLYEVVPVEIPAYSAPFSSGNFDHYRKELTAGYGPNPDLLTTLLGASFKVVAPARLVTTG